MLRSLLYGFGSFGLSVTSLVIGNWLLYFYLPPNGQARLPASLYGLAFFCGYLVAALITPWIGYFSDHFRSAWGRRLPFLFGFAFLVAALFFSLWLPPLAGQSAWNLVYLLVMMVLYRVALAFYQVPYQALLPELAVTDVQRAQLSAWQSGLLLLGFIAGGMSGILLEAWGTQRMALTYALIALLAFLSPAGAVWLSRGQGLASATRQPLHFLQALRLILVNRAFLYFALAWSLYMMTSMLVQNISSFLITEVCLLNQADTIYFYLPSVLVSLLCYPLVTRLTRRLGKRRVYIASLVAAACIFPCIWLISDRWLFSLKAQCISWAVLQAAAISGAVVLSSAFLAEITDEDAYRTGQRREGMYVAASKVLEQIFVGAASLLLPLLLLFGRGRSDPYGPLGVRLAGVAGGVFMLAAALLMRKYPRLME